MMGLLRRVRPGIYEDGTGLVHLDLAEMLVAHGWPASAANIEIMRSAAHEVIADLYPDATVEEVG